ncbi:hypothetical protein BaRGS_00011821 [Batillaria attramentaria]|uniref:Uncharacterized protein n=1 Tax=Batillaria attramentaria TaxID=370345 RepID=A0ABD0LB96_9CAEN
MWIGLTVNSKTLSHCSQFLVCLATDIVYTSVYSTPRLKVAELDHQNTPALLKLLCAQVSTRPSINTVPSVTVKGEKRVRRSGAHARAWHLTVSQPVAGRSKRSRAGWPVFEIIDFCSLDSPSFFVGPCQLPGEGAVQID